MDKLLQPAINERYQSASEVLEDIALLRSRKQQLKVPGKTSTQNTSIRRNLTGWEKAGIGATIVLALTSAIGFVQNHPVSQQVAEPVKTVKISSSQGIDYRKLRNYLQQKNWESADRETHEIMLTLAGKYALERGSIKSSFLDDLSCNELQTIDDLWRAESKGKLGLSAQQVIYEQQGLNWKKMYAKVGWGRFTDEEFTKTVDQEFDWQTRRLRYKAEMEPNFQNPPPGHLPVTMNLVKGKAFPQFASICKF